MTTTHLDSELSEFRAHIDSMLEVVSTGRRRIRANLMSQLQRMTTDVKPEMLTDSELAAFVAVLQAAHARVITPPAGDRPFLRIVPRATAKGSGE